MRLPSLLASDSPLRTVGEGVHQRLLRHDTTLLAAGVAFFALLSLVPALVALVSVYGLVADPADVAGQIDKLSVSVPPSTRAFLSDQVTQLTTGSHGELGVVLAISIAVALWSASSAVRHLLGALDVAFGRSLDRRFVVARAKAVGLTAAAVGVMVVLISVLAVLPAVVGRLDLSGLITPLSWLVATGVAMVALAVAYRLSAGEERGWRVVTWGTGVAGGVWLVGSVGFSLYASRAGRFDEVYGALAAVVVTMLWLFIGAFAALLGAEVEAELAARHRGD